MKISRYTVALFTQWSILVNSTVKDPQKVNTPEKVALQRLDSLHILVKLSTKQIIPLVNRHLRLTRDRFKTNG